MNKPRKHKSKAGQKGFAILETIFFIPIFIILASVLAEFSYLLWVGQNTNTLLRESTNTVYRTCVTLPDTDIPGCLQQSANTVFDAQFQNPLPNLNQNLTLILKTYRWDALQSQMNLIGTYTTGSGGQTSRLTTIDFVYLTGNLGQDLGTIFTVEVFYNYQLISPIVGFFDALLGRALDLPEVIYASAII